MGILIATLAACVAAYLIGGDYLLYMVGINIVVVAVFSLVLRKMPLQNPFAAFVWSVTLGTAAELLAVESGVQGTMTSLSLAWVFFLPTFILLLFTKHIQGGWRRFFLVLPVCLMLFLHMIAVEASKDGGAHLLPFWTGIFFFVIAATWPRSKEVTKS